jgi:hypothetical protein
MAEHDVSFDAMGSHVRLLIGEPGPGMPPAPAAAEAARRFVLEFDRALSRFRPESELCALNGAKGCRPRSCCERLSKPACGPRS